MFDMRTQNNILYIKKYKVLKKHVKKLFNKIYVKTIQKIFKKF